MNFSKIASHAANAIIDHEIKVHNHRLATDPQYAHDCEIEKLEAAEIEKAKQEKRQNAIKHGAASLSDILGR